VGDWTEIALETPEDAMWSTQPLLLFPLLVNLSADEPATGKQEALRRYRQAPACFIANLESPSGKRIVPRDEVLAFVQTAQGRLLFTASGAFMALPQTGKIGHGTGRTGAPHRQESGDWPSPARVVLHAGISPQRAAKQGLQPRLAEPSGARFNYLIGPREQWQTDLPGFGKLVYDQIWPGVNLEYQATMDHLTVRLRVAAQGQVKELRLETGARHLRLAGDGSMTAELAGAVLHLSAPRASQKVRGEDRAVEVAFVPLPGGAFAFEMAAYDAGSALTLDTQLSWSSYLGGWVEDQGEDIALDGSGKAYVVGTTNATYFPTTAGAYDVSYNGGSQDTFVCMLNSGGSSLVYATYLGGSDVDQGRAIAVDSSGNAFIAGSTRSNNFPATGGSYDATYNGNYDAFVAKLNSSGSSVYYITYVGGTGSDRGADIALDASGRAFLTGNTTGLGFPTTAGAFSTVYGGGSTDAFITVLEASGAALFYSTFFGGSAGDYGEAIALDSAGRAHVTGNTLSSNFPISSGALDVSHNGGADVFAIKLSESGAGINYSTYLGSASDDYGEALALDSSGNAFIAGQTNSTGFPTTAGAHDTSFNGGWQDAFVCKLSSNGHTLIYSTFLGGSEDDGAFAVGCDASGNAVVAGFTQSSNFPITAAAFDLSFNGGEEDAFVSKLNSGGSSLLFSTFLGGKADEYANALALDGSGKVYVLGNSESPNFPTTAGAADTSHNGGNDAFVTALNSNGASLSYSTFIGGKDQDFGQAIALDGSDHVYVTGNSESNNFPTTYGAYDRIHNGTKDVFVSKWLPDGSDLVYSTYLGGSGTDYGTAIAVDASGQAYVAGHTSSTNFPTSPGAFDTSHNGGSRDGFVSVLTSAGSALYYSTFLGGSDWDQAQAIALDSSGNAHVTGYTSSSNFPTTAGAFDTSHNGNYDIFVTKLHSSGTMLLYSTFLGGSSSDYGFGIALNSAGLAYVAGSTYSANYPTMAGSWDTSHNGGMDALVTRISSTGATLNFSTFLGGSDQEEAKAISLDPSGNAYVAGLTFSSDFPTTGGSFDPSHNGNGDGFVFKLTSNGTLLSYCTYLGGPGDDAAYGIAVSGSHMAHVTGASDSSTFPVTGWAFDPTINGASDAFVSVLNSGGSWLSHSTFLGGGDVDVGQAIALGSDGQAYVTGYTYSADFPCTENPQLPVLNGNTDAFVTKLCPEVAPPSTIIGETDVCAGASETYSIESVTGATTYNWTVPPGASIYVGQGTPMITVNFGASSGTIQVSTGNACATSAQRALHVAVHSSVWATLSPPSAAQGLLPLHLNGGPMCGAPNYQVQWSNLTSGQLYPLNQYIITVSPLLSQSSVFELSVTDGRTRATVLRQVPVLVHHYGILDWDGNNCSEIEDLWAAAPFWRQSHAQDPNADGFIDVRDLLYINTDGCP